ncbi:hypothetical protein GGR26_003624 [Lewinella marina]|uniref:hypothetical protein n=1 Tax=Neolewinella marina TaxID=438751 RepID=UPI00117B4552|nr:hypothetical protein [Neolewinella marina]NJB87837.1 hypothetical protein [Neolewinella marina]
MQIKIKLLIALMSLCANTCIAQIIDLKSNREYYSPDGAVLPTSETLKLRLINPDTLADNWLGLKSADIESIKRLDEEGNNVFLIDESSIKNTPLNKATQPTINWLNYGKLGFTGGTQPIASLDILRLNIGNPNIRTVQLDLTTTVTQEGFDETPDNQLTFNSLIQPTGGLVNLIFSKNDMRFYPLKNDPKRSDKTSSLDFGVSGGFKLLGTRSETDSVSSTIPTGYADAGIIFTADAFDRNNSLTNKGRFLAQARLFTTAILTGAEPIDEALGISEKSFVHGITADLVVEVSGLLQLRVNFAQAFSFSGLSKSNLNRHVFTIAANYDVSNSHGNSNN